MLLAKGQTQTHAVSLDNKFPTSQVKGGRSRGQLELLCLPEASEKDVCALSIPSHSSRHPYTTCHSQEMLKQRGVGARMEIQQLLSPDAVSLLLSPFLPPYGHPCVRVFPLLHPHRCLDVSPMGVWLGSVVCSGMQVG